MPTPNVQVQRLLTNLDGGDHLSEFIQTLFDISTITYDDGDVRHGRIDPRVVAAVMEESEVLEHDHRAIRELRDTLDYLTTIVDAVAPPAVAGTGGSGSSGLWPGTADLS